MPVLDLRREARIGSHVALNLDEQVGQLSVGNTVDQLRRLLLENIVREESIGPSGDSRLRKALLVELELTKLPLGAPIVGILPAIFNDLLVI